MAFQGRRLLTAMCLGQVANLIPHVVVPAVMAVHLIPLWGLSASAAGFMASAYAIGYMIAVPVLTTLTDRIDAKLILITGSAVSGLATIAFGLFADGLVSAALLWGLAGAGFAGAYMPGLRALTDRLGEGDNSRAISAFTGSFSFGVGLSFLVSQVLADGLGWRAAFVITGLLPAVMIVVCLGLDRRPPKPKPGALLDFRPVLKNRTAMGYVLGYGVHCFELYGFRTWIVGFWTFVAAHNGGSAYLSPIMVSVIVTLIAMPASMYGNELAIRHGRHRAISLVMLGSAATAIAIGLGTGASPLLLLGLLLIYSFTLPGDSGALTSGMSGSAEPSHRGATMAMHSMVGFGCSALGGWLVGVAIDAAGGPMSESGWRAAFLVMGASIILGPLILRWSRARIA